MLTKMQNLKLLPNYFADGKTIIINNSRINLRECNTACVKPGTNANIDAIKINHRCYFYIKNLNIENRVLISGMIEY